MWDQVGTKWNVQLDKEICVELPNLIYRSEQLSRGPVEPRKAV